MFNIGAQSLWVDEGFSYEVARHPLRAIFGLLAAEDRHPPLYYVMLNLAIRTFGRSELALRFPSAAAGVLSLPLAYRLSRCFFKGEAASLGVFATLLLALSPFQIWYSQEARMYTSLAALAGLSLVALIRVIKRGSPIDVVLYSMVCVAALYTHYHAAFVWLAEVALVPLIRGPGRRHALVGLAGAGLLFMPWLPYMLQQLSRAPAGYVPEQSFIGLLTDVASAFVGGESTALSGWLVASVVVLALIGAVRSGRSGLALLTLALVGPTAAYAVSAATGVQIRAIGRMYHIAGLLPFVLLVSRGVWSLLALRPRPIGRFAVLSVSVALVSLEGVELARQARYDHKEDFRAAASIVSTREAPSDTIIFDAEYIFRPFMFYYRGTTPWHRAVVEFDKVDPTLRKQTSDRDRVWLVLSHDDIADPQALVRRWFDAHATPLDEWWLGGVHIRLYGMEQRPGAAPLRAAGATPTRLGAAVDLLSATVTSPERAGTALHARVVWRNLRPQTSELHAVLTLRDGAGRVVARLDRVAVSPFYPSTRWLVGEYLSDWYDFVAPLGLRRGRYRVELSLYEPDIGALMAPDGREAITLGEVEIPPSFAGSVFRGEPLGRGIELLSAVLPSLVAKPGDDVAVELVWHTVEARAATPRLELVGSDGKVVVERPIVPADGGYPFEQWAPGEVVLDRPLLRLPGRLPPGNYRLRLVLDRARDLGSLSIQDLRRNFETPAPQYAMSARLGVVAEFMGYDIDTAPSRPGGTVGLTLYWRAVSDPPTSYTVFVHLIGPDGQIHGQRDARPLDGSRPTTSWVAGEVLRDHYQVQVEPEAPAGSYAIQVGMYQPDTGERVQLSGGGDAITLGERLEVRR